MYCIQAPYREVSTREGNTSDTSFWPCKNRWRTGTISFTSLRVMSTVNISLMAKTFRSHSLFQDLIPCSGTVNARCWIFLSEMGHWYVAIGLLSRLWIPRFESRIRSANNKSPLLRGQCHTWVLLWKCSSDGLVKSTKVLVTWSEDFQFLYYING